MKRIFVVSFVLIAATALADSNKPSEKELMPLLQQYVSAASKADPDCQLFQTMGMELPSDATLKHVEIKIHAINGPTGQMYPDKTWTVWPIYIHLAIRYFNPTTKMEQNLEGDQMYYAARDPHNQTKWIVFHCYPPKS